MKRKRWLAFALSAAMIFTCAGSAFASEVTDAADAETEQTDAASNGNGESAAVSDGAAEVNAYASDDIIDFPDENLLNALLSNYGLDADADGAISREELADCYYLSLSYCDITDLTGLEYAVNVRWIYLSGNEDLENIDALFDLEKLEYVSLSNTNVPADEQMRLAQPKSNMEMGKGFMDSIFSIDVENDALIVKVTKGTDILTAEYNSYVLAEEAGEAQITVSLGDYSETLNVTVNGIDADQPVGDSVDAEITTAGYGAILDSNETLWEVYPEAGEIRSDAEQYVSGWVYGLGIGELYGYAIDADGTLWSGEIQLAENITEAKGHYALDENGVLWDVYSDAGGSIENVVDWTESYIYTNYDYETMDYFRQGITYILKTDGTLWKRSENAKDADSSADLELLAEDVQEIGAYCYLQTNGDVYYYGDSVATYTGAASISSSEYGYLGADGFYRYKPEGIETVAIVDYLYALADDGDYYSYYLTEDGEVVQYQYTWQQTDTGSGKWMTEMETVAENIVDIDRDLNSGKLICQAEDGLYRTLAGDAATEDEPFVIDFDVPTTSNGTYFYLENYGIAEDYSLLTQNYITLLTHVKSVWTTDIGAVVALRTDGTVWRIEENGVPEQILTLSATGGSSNTDSSSTSSGDSLAVRRGNAYYFSYTIHAGGADKVIYYGRTADEVLVGDWDGDGVDTICVRRGNVYYFSNSLKSGEADRVVAYGKATDEVLVGDWNGDGKDTLAVRRGNTYYIKNSISGGNADKVVAYGKANDEVLVGDWDGDKKDTLAVRRGNTYYIKNSISGGDADKVVAYGKADDEVYAGSWN
ncbi:MAG: hypothetical protein LUG54_11160 [Clostridiales bacterium]|nr:hypothetical protein [Clostridiales bacterium]